MTPPISGSGNNGVPGSGEMLAKVLDVPLLDSFLLDLLFLNENWSLPSTTAEWPKPLLQLFTTLSTQGQDMALPLLGLQWVPSSRIKVWVYATLAASMPRIYRWIITESDHLTEPSTVPTPSSLRMIAIERRQRLLQGLRSFIRRAGPTIQFAALLSFLSGYSSTPQFAMQLTGCRYQSKQSSNKLSTDLAYRRWFYLTTMQTLRILLLGLPTLWDMLQRHGQGLFRQLILWARSSNVPTHCPVCHRLPNIPVRTDCGHVYCYVCAYEANVCRTCRAPIEQIKHVVGTRDEAFVSRV